MIMVKLILLISISLSICACFPDTYGGMKDFNREIAEAEKAELKGDYQLAKQKYFAALMIAERIEWSNGKITATGNLAEMYILEKNYNEGEKLLLEAKELCKSSSDCYGLGGFYDSLMFFYLFDLKDINKAESIVEEVVSVRQKVSDDMDIKVRLNKYAEEMRQSNFEPQSQALLIRIASIE
jgi:tetratricopeptide (TPR) repeat protein